MRRTNVLNKVVEIEFRGTCAHGCTADETCSDCTRAENDIADEAGDDAMRIGHEQTVEEFLVAAAQREDGKCYTLADLEQMWSAPLC